MRIEDYALIGDTQTSALVGRDGSIDWACFPRFDSGASFAALLGDRGNGHWQIAPAAPVRKVHRRYRDGTLILETVFETDEGVVRLTDFMPVRTSAPDVVRIVEGISGRVSMQVDLVVRFDYGRVVPWVRKQEDGVLTAIAGPDAICVRGDIDLHGQDLATVGQFTVEANDQRHLILTWFPSHDPVPVGIDPGQALLETENWWKEWSGRCQYQGPWGAEVRTSLMVLKALTYAPTGGIVAAPTTSLPEWPGGVRNWDYRFCWLRDATLTLYALMLGGYMAEAVSWRDWLLRAAGGDPDRLQIMYGVAGEQRLPEMEVPWLGGYEQSRPVRLGNQAHQQLQLDVYGELIDAMYAARRFGIGFDTWSWALERSLLDYLESRWRDADTGIWELRGPPRQLTHSKVMAWVAFDRAIKSVEMFQLEGPVERWRVVRDEIHAEVCLQGFDPQRNSFTQSYGRPEVDASLLLIPLVGFLPPDDDRVRGTVAAIERDLLHDGFVLRYRTGVTPGAVAAVAAGAAPPSEALPADGLPPGEGVFLPCSFWLADAYVQMGRRQDATRLFERLLALRNDVGLLSEEYDPGAGRLLGNFPQAFTHLALVNTAYNLAGKPGDPAHHRGDG